MKKSPELDPGLKVPSPTLSDTQGEGSGSHSREAAPASRIAWECSAPCRLTFGMVAWLRVYLRGWDRSFCRLGDAVEP
jgi:hypothetical protein